MGRECHGGILQIGLVYMVRGDEHVEGMEKDISPWFGAGDRMEGGAKKISEDMLDKK